MLQASALKVVLPIKVANSIKYLNTIILYSCFAKSFPCVFLRCSQQAPVLGGFKIAPYSQRGSERGSPQDTHVVCRHSGTPLRSGCFWGLCAKDWYHSARLTSLCLPRPAVWWLLNSIYCIAPFACVFLFSLVGLCSRAIVGKGKQPKSIHTLPLLVISQRCCVFNMLKLKSSHVPNNSLICSLMCARMLMFTNTHLGCLCCCQLVSDV